MRACCSPPTRIFSAALSVVLLGIVAVDAKAQFATPLPKVVRTGTPTPSTGTPATPSPTPPAGQPQPSEGVMFTLASSEDDSASGEGGISLFSRLASGFTSDRAYVATSVISGFIGQRLFEVTYAQVVAAGDAGDASTRKQIRDNVSTVTRLVQNGGAATARLLVPITAPAGRRVGAGTLQVYGNFSGGAVGRSSDEATDDQRGAAGAVLETLATWRVQDRPAGTPVATVHFGVRGGTHYVFNGRILPDVQSRWLHVGQAVFMVRQNNTVSFGVTATAVGKQFRPYVPRAHFIVSAGIL
jgi:hypothetical protein